MAARPFLAVPCFLFFDKKVYSSIYEVSSGMVSATGIGSNQSLLLAYEDVRRLIPHLYVQFSDLTLIGSIWTLFGTCNFPTHMSWATDVPHRVWDLICTSSVFSF